MYRTWNDSRAIFDQDMHNQKHGKRYICESKQKVDNIEKYIQGMIENIKITRLESINVSFQTLEHIIY